MGAAIAHSILDTREMAPGEGVALFREEASVIFDFRPVRDGEPSHLRFEAFDVCGCVIDRFKATSANAYERSRSRIGRDGRDFFTLQVLDAGRWASRDGARTAHAGDLIVLDMAQPQSMTGSDEGALHLNVPRHLLAGRLNAIDEHNMQVVAGSNPLVTLFRANLALLFTQLHRMNRQDAQAATIISIDLAAAAIDGMREDRRNSINIAVVEQVRRYIDSHLLDHRLDARNISVAFGFSRRKLYGLFEPYGGVMAYITSKRLGRARAALRDPSNSHETIASTAHRHGFVHYRSFARAFEKQFGFSPRAMRHAAHTSPGNDCSNIDQRVAWAAWLRNLN